LSVLRCESAWEIREATISLRWWPEGRGNSRSHSEPGNSTAVYFFELSFKKRELTFFNIWITDNYEKKGMDLKTGSVYCPDPKILIV